jgi:hypothetical protein
LSPLVRVWVRRTIPLLALGLAAGLFFVNLQYVKLAPAQNDFVSKWVAGSEWIQNGISPYDPQISLESEQRVYGRPANADRGEDPVHFLYPMPVVVLFAPLGILDYGSALAIWMSLLEIALLGGSLLWVPALAWRPSGWMVAALLAFSALWFPAFAALVQGQIVILAALFLAGGLAAMRGRRDALAGFLFVAALIKPQLAVGVLVYTLIWAFVVGRRQLIGWVIAGLVLIVGISLLLEPRWPLEMLRQLFDYFRLPLSQSAVGRLSAWFGFGTVGTLVMTGGALVYLVWEWKESIPGDPMRFLWTAALTQCIMLAVIPFATLPNLITLVFPIAVILEAWYVRHGTSTDGPAALVLALLAIASWLPSIETLSGGEPSLWLLLGLPVASALGLTWVRWWSYRIRGTLDLGSTG